MCVIACNLKAMMQALPLKPWDWATTQFNGSDPGVALFQAPLLKRANFLLFWVIFIYVFTLTYNHYNPCSLVRKFVNALLVIISIIGAFTTSLCTVLSVVLSVVLLKRTTERTPGCECRPFTFVNTVLSTTDLKIDLPHLIYIAFDT